MTTETEAPRAEAGRVLRQFRIVFNAVKSHFQQMEKIAGIGGAQIWALSVVAERPGIGTSALAQAMDIHQSTTSNLVKSLTERKLLSADRDVRDRRAVRLRISLEGQALLNQVPGPWSGILPEALVQLDRDTLCRLEQDLDNLIAGLKYPHNHRAAKTPLADL